MGRALAWVYVAAVVLLPILALLSRDLPATFAAVGAVTHDPRSLSAVGLTVSLGLITAIICVIAALLSVDNPRLPAWFDRLVELPLAIPSIVTGLMFIEIYRLGGPFLNQPLGILGVLIFLGIPLAIRPVQSAFRPGIASEMEAARLLGATKWDQRRYRWRALRPGIIAAFALVFGRVIGEFGALTLVGGNVPFRTELISTSIFSAAESDAAARGRALILISLALTITAAAIAERFSPRREAVKS